MEVEADAATDTWNSNFCTGDYVQWGLSVSFT